MEMPQYPSTTHLAHRRLSTDIGWTECVTHNVQLENNLENMHCLEETFIVQNNFKQ